MKNKKTVLKFTLIVLALGMTVIGVNGCVDRSLNGTWVSKWDQLKFDSGNFERSSKDGTTPISQGTYTTKNNEITDYPKFATFGLGSRWYSKKDEGLGSTYFNPSSKKYTLNGSMLTIGSTIYTLVSPDGKFTKAKATGNTKESVSAKKSTGNTKESVPAKKSSGSVSSFPGRWHLIEGDGDAENVELFKDGTGTADGNGITWKVENGRFHILHPFFTFSAYYNVTGSTVTFTQDDGEVIKYQKK